MDEKELKSLTKKAEDRYQEEAPKYEEQVNADLTNVFEAELPVLELENAISEKLKSMAVPTPTLVPQILECNQTEFMSLPDDHFCGLVIKHNYGKIVSALTYVQNISSKNEPKVLERVHQLKAALRNHKTNGAGQNHNIRNDHSVADNNAVKPLIAPTNQP